jgi:hypothetical protein
MTRAALVGTAMVYTAMAHAEVQEVSSGGTPAFGGCYGAGVGGRCGAGLGDNHIFLRGYGITQAFSLCE